MELLEGTTLAEEAKLSPIAVPRAVRILLQIGDALHAAHRHGIIHRDLKPDNVFLLPGDVVRILDLGIAKFLNDTAEANKTHSNAILGTPHTMSPEQCRGSHIDHRSDIYAFGVVAYRILAARWPIEGQYIGDIQAGHMFEEPPSLHQIAPWVPGGVADVIHRALKKDPAGRFQSMADLCDALSPYAEASGPQRATGPTAPTVQAVPREISSSHGRRSPAPRRDGGGRLLRVVAIVLLLGGGGAAVYYAAIGKGPVLRGSSQEGMAPPTPLAKTSAPQEAAEMFRVFIDVAPADAEVLVDGVSQAARPIVVEGLPGRSFTVEGRRDGYREASVKGRIGNRDERMSLRLTEERPEAEVKQLATGTLYVNVEPWAFVSIDGGKSNETPFQVKLPAGSHRLVIENPALKKRKEMKVVVTPGKTKKIDVDLNRSE
jgi:serine/threonine-protein kinase